MAEEIYTSKDINKAIQAQIKKGAATRIEGLDGQDNIAVGLSADTKVTIVGNAGDFFGALNNGTTLLVEGGAGRFLGDTMLSGKIVVRGDAEDGAGANMSGGMILVKGSAGSKVGAGMKGGAIIIDGDVGDDLGIYLIDGDIVVTGDAGKNIGINMLGGSIYLNGKVGGLGRDAVTQKLDREDRLRLTNYLTKENILGEFKFKKVVSKKEYSLEMIKNYLSLAHKKDEEEELYS
jgi:glutamate synthase domain-containing protein 3